LRSNEPGSFVRDFGVRTLDADIIEGDRDPANHLLEVRLTMSHHMDRVREGGEAMDDMGLARLWLQGEMGDRFGGAQNPFPVCQARLFDLGECGAQIIQ